MAQVPRHLRGGAHNISAEDAKNWKKVYRHLIDFEDHRRGKKQKDKRPFLICPICKCPTTRMDKHLKGKRHGLTGTKYLSYRALAKQLRPKSRKCETVTSSNTENSAKCRSAEDSCSSSSQPIPSQEKQVPNEDTTAASSYIVDSPKLLEQGGLDMNYDENDETSSNEDSLKEDGCSVASDPESIESPYQEESNSTDDVESIAESCLNTSSCSPNAMGQESDRDSDNAKTSPCPPNVRTKDQQSDSDSDSDLNSANQKRHFNSRTDLKEYLPTYFFYSLQVIMSFHLLRKLQSQ